MATAAHVVIDQVLQRVRDPEGVTASRDFVRLMIGKAQQLINAKTATVVDETALTTEPLRCFYPLVSLIPRSQLVTFVRDSSGKDLLPVSWKSFWYKRRGWPRATADRMQEWATIGRDLIVLWPARLVAETVTVVSARLTPLLANEGSLLEVQDSVVPAITDLATALVLLKMRKGDMAMEAMSSCVARVVAQE